MAERLEGACVPGSQEAGWCRAQTEALTPGQVFSSPAPGWVMGGGGGCEFLRGARSHRLWTIEGLGYSGDSGPLVGRPGSGRRSGQSTQLGSSGHQPCTRDPSLVLRPWEQSRAGTGLRPCSVAYFGREQPQL